MIADAGGQEKKSAILARGNIVSRRLVGAGASALIGRLLQIVVSALTGLLIPFCLPPKEVGTFFIVQVLVAAGAIVAQFGLTISAPAMIAQARALNDWGRARLIASRMLAICVIFGVLVSTVVGASILALSSYSSQTIVFTLHQLIVLVVPLPLLLALLAVIVEIYRSIDAIEEASLLPAMPGLMLGLLILGSLASSIIISLKGILEIQVLAVAVIVVLGATRLRLRVRKWRNPDEEGPSIAKIIGASWPNLLTTICLFLVATADIWIVGVIGNVIEVAKYGLGARLAALFLVPLATVNATIVPQIVVKWTRNRRRSLGWLLTVTATGATLVTAIGLLIFLLMGQVSITAVWGPSYHETFLVAAMLALGNLVQTAGGSSGNLLLLLGQQRLAMLITVLLGLLTISAASLAMLEFGIIGVAAVYAGANIIRTLIFICAVRNRFGLNTAARLINPMRLRALTSFRR